MNTTVVPIFLPLSVEPTEGFFWATLVASLLLFLGWVGMIGLLKPAYWRRRRAKEVPFHSSWVSCNLPTLCLISFFVGVVLLNVGAILRFHSSVAFFSPLLTLASLVLIIGPVVLMVRR